MLRKRNQLPLYLLLLLSLLLILGCPPKQTTVPGVPSQSSQSAESVAYKTVLMAFDAYDLGMITLRTLQKQNIITEAQYTAIKDKYGWPCWTALKAADVAVNTWVTTKSTSDFEKMNAAFTGMYEIQKLLSNQITQLQGGK